MSVFRLIAAADFSPRPRGAPVRPIGRLGPRRPAAAVEGAAGAPWSDIEGRIAIEVAGGPEPMLSADGRLAVVLDGTLSNRAALLDELAALGRRLRTARAEEVLLHLWDLEGPAMLWRLAGCFAIALWDGRRAGVLLARDGPGVRPLYIAAGPHGVVAASRVADAVAVEGVPRDPCPAGHVGFHLHGHVPEPFSLYRAVRAVPAGGALWIDRDGARPIGRFWSAAARLGGPAGGSTIAGPSADGPLVPCGPRTRRQTLRAAIVRSLDAQLPEDGDVVAALSGGPASAALAGFARRAGRLAGAVSIGVAADDGPAPTATARALGVALRRVGVDGAASAETADWTDGLDQPSLTAPVFALAAAAAARAGATGLLVGCGGDALFGGAWRTDRPTALDALRRAVWRQVLAPLAEAGLLSPALALRLEADRPIDPKAALRHLDPDFVRTGLAALAAEASALDRLAPPGRAIAAQLDGPVRDGPLRDAQNACDAFGLALVAPLMDGGILDRLGPWFVAPNAPTGRSLLSLGAPSLLAGLRDRPVAGTPASPQIAGRHLLGRALARDWRDRTALSAALIARATSPPGSPRPVE